MQIPHTINAESAVEVFENLVKFIQDDRRLDSDYVNIEHLHHYTAPNKWHYIFILYTLEKK